MTANNIASESGHYYWPDASPAYEIENKSKPGTFRATTLRDCRKMGLVPSVTTVLQVVAKPGLERWKQTQLLQSALTLPMIAGESIDDYAERIIRDSQEQAATARDLGTEIHGAIERHFLGKPHDHAGKVACAIGELPPGQEWSAEKSFACWLGYGGKCDLHSSGWVIDFKTKADDDLGDLKTWDEHHMQLAAYRYGLGVEKARCAIVYVSTTADAARLIELTDGELVRGWEMFNHALALWKATKKYYCGQEPGRIAA